MKKVQGCISGAAISLLCGVQAQAAALPFNTNDATLTDQTTTDCPTTNTCKSVLTSTRFYQRQMMDAQGNRYFQAIDTETAPPEKLDSDLTFYDESFVSALFNSGLNLCPAEHYCGHRISHLVHQQDSNGDYWPLGTAYEQEFTDGTNIGIQTLQPGQIQADIKTIYTAWDQTPFHFFNTTQWQELSPGRHIIATMAGDGSYLASNLQLLRSNIEPDLTHIELNQQDTTAQALYRHILDIEINLPNRSMNLEENIADNAIFSTHLNTPVQVPEHYELSIRVLMPTGWQDFITNENNQLSAAEKLASGYCPGPDSPLYLNTFGSNDACLRITIEDGGPNDGDETIDGRVIFTSGAIAKAIQYPLTLEQQDKTTTVANDEVLEDANIGTGTWPAWFSLLLLFRLALAWRKPSP